MQRGYTIWFTGLSGAGKTTLSNLLHHKLQENGITNIEILDGDIVRTHLSKGLGFTKEDRDTNIRRIGWVAHLLTKHRVPNLVSAISPYREVRSEVRKMIEHAGGAGAFIEVFVDCPVEVCEERDVKGLYAKARKGEIKQFTGIDDPYEAPHNPEVHIRTDQLTTEEGVGLILKHLAGKGFIPEDWLSSCRAHAE
ncbi:MAG: adenylyl-sulfate kinase [Thermodesulfobacteriota bacterium]|nr:MAG: adenylyl-sulfate kinase [Thermodesulfobacteriota bacterium]